MLAVQSTDIQNNLQRLKDNFDEIKIYCEQTNQLIKNWNNKNSKRDFINNLRKIQTKMDDIMKLQKLIENKIAMQKSMNRRKGLETMQQRLINHIRTGDSLDNFINLMRRNPTTGGTTTTTTTTNYYQRYPNTNTWFHFNNPPHIRRRYLDDNHCVKIERKNKLPVYDILDEIINEDVTPLHSEYPRKDSIFNYIPKPTKKLLKNNTKKKIDDDDDDDDDDNNNNDNREIKKNNNIDLSYLHKLVDNNDDPEKNLWKQLFQPPPQVLTILPVQVYYDTTTTKEITRKVKDKINQQKKINKNNVNMIEQLKLINNNNNIENNIQNTIDLIESKMIDLLSTDNKNNEVFDEMEMEVTKLLNMIEKNEKTKIKKPQQTTISKFPLNKSVVGGGSGSGATTILKSTITAPSSIGFTTGFKNNPNKKSKIKLQTTPATTKTKTTIEKLDDPLIKEQSKLIDMAISEKLSNDIKETAERIDNYCLNIQTNDLMKTKIKGYDDGEKRENGDNVETKKSPIYEDIREIVEILIDNIHIDEGIINKVISEYNNYYEIPEISNQYEIVYPKTILYSYEIHEGNLTDQQQVVTDSWQKSYLQKFYGIFFIFVLLIFNINFCC